MRIADRVIPKLLPIHGGGQGLRPDKPPQLRPHLIEQVPQAALAVAPQHLDLLLVHLHIPCEHGLSRQDPPPSPVPPPSQWASDTEVPEGRHGLGLAEGPCGGGRGEGLDPDREGGDPLPKPDHGGGGGGAFRRLGLGDGELVLVWHCGEEFPLLDGLNEGRGHFLQIWREFSSLFFWLFL